MRLSEFLKSVKRQEVLPSTEQIFGLRAFAAIIANAVKHASRQSLQTAIITRESDIRSIASSPDKVITWMRRDIIPQVVTETNQVWKLLNKDLRFTFSDAQIADELDHYMLVAIKYHDPFATLRGVKNFKTLYIGTLVNLLYHTAVLCLCHARRGASIHLIRDQELVEPQDVYFRKDIKTLTTPRFESKVLHQMIQEALTLHTTSIFGADWEPCPSRVQHGIMSIILTSNLPVTQLKHCNDTLRHMSTGQALKTTGQENSVKAAKLGAMERNSLSDSGGCCNLRDRDMNSDPCVFVICDRCCLIQSVPRGTMICPQCERLDAKLAIMKEYGLYIGKRILPKGIQMHKKPILRMVRTTKAFLNLSDTLAASHIKVTPTISAPPKPLQLSTSHSAYPSAASI